jgi:hypothetical protein
MTTNRWQLTNWSTGGFYQYASPTEGVDLGLGGIVEIMI